MADGSNGTGANRREWLMTALLGGTAVGLSACASDADGGGLRLFAGGGKAEDGAKLSLRTIEAAERVNALNFTGEERRQMLEALEENVEALGRLRALKHPNDLQPALTFDPRLPGKTYPMDQRDRVRLGGALGDQPGTEEDIAFASAAQQAKWMAEGALTSRQLTEIYLKRIERYRGALYNFVTVTADLAREQADQADRERATGKVRGALHGLPFGLKDIIDVKGLPATWGATPYKDRVGTVDATAYTKLREAGAVLLGKTTNGAIAYGDIWFGGRTRNPWDPREGSSGSSAGSASATAAGLCSFSIGTETLGSILSPSERCGTTGLRPTFGRVSRAGAMALCWSLDKIGPICRSVEDTALVLAALNGHDAGDASSIAAGFSYDGRSALKDMTIGYVPAWFEEADAIDKAVLEAAKGLGAKLVEVTAPDIPADLLVSQLLVEAAAAFEQLTLDDLDDQMVWQDDSAWPNTFRAARFFPAVDLIQIDRLRRRTMEAMGAVFSGVDVLLSPNFAGGILTMTNFTGHPQLSFRAGFRETTPRSLWNDEAEADDLPKARTPHNVSVLAGLFDEGKAIRVARALEGAMNAWRERPGAASSGVRVAGL